jgi:hypothetical protein
MQRCTMFLFLCATIVFGLAAVASADLIGFDIQMRYVTSYNSSGTDIGQLGNSTTVLGDGSTQTTVTLDGVGVTHKFEMYIVTHLPSDTDGIMFLRNKAVTGGVTTAAADYAASAFSLTAVDPPPMGPAGNQSNASASAQWFTNACNSNGWTGICNNIFGSSTGLGNGTYGDLAAYMHIGRDTPYDVGSIKLHTTGVGTFTWHDNGGSNFQAVSGNDGSSDLMGMGKSSPTYYPTQTLMLNDMVVFANAPEPSSIVLLGFGLFGLLAYAWRKRN